MTRLAAAVLAAWGVVGAELLTVGILHRGRIASVWELQFGVLWLLPALLAASAAVAVVATGFWWLVEKSAEARWARTACGLALFFGAGASAWSVGTGRHLADPIVRGSFAAGVGAVVALAVWGVAPRVAAWAKHPTPFAAAVVLGAIGLELVNRFVLVRLYPGFHVSLTLATLALAPAIVLLVKPARSRWPLAAIAVTAVGLAVGAPAAAQRLAHFDNFRILLLDEAPIAGQTVRLAARLAPPPPIRAEPEICVGGDCARPSESLELRDHDVLLISVDALRADHVGAYGYRREVSPHIDALARTGVVFEHAYCPTPHTSYSITSLMTGKYMRPLLLQGAGKGSDTWATFLRRYGYRTAAFYPPAIFFIDRARFAEFQTTGLGFEYRREEFLEGAPRARQVEQYLSSVGGSQRVFVWVHLFGPHEPYEAHEGFEFGDRDIDRYDSEIAAADATVGRIVKDFRERRPRSVVIVTSDHGEEFGEHGGRYHGTTVYEEQVRVPLIVNVPGIPPRRVRGPVQTLDLLPTVLAGLDVPRPPRIRGTDLGAKILGKAKDEGFAMAETDEYTLLAQDRFRLVCARQIGACRLYDIDADPGQTKDVSAHEVKRFETMRERLRALGASHGRYERRGLQAEGRSWPAAILRGVTGDGDAAAEVASLLDDADLSIRRKAAEVLFELGREDTAAALRLALGRDEDEVVRRWCALALTRLGQGAPLAYELVDAAELEWKRLSALALAESGDDRGVGVLVAWWKDEDARDYRRSRQILDAFAKVRAKDAVWPLAQSLDDVRLRPFIAAALAAIGEEVARGPLVKALKRERYQSARVALARAIVDLDGEADLAGPLVRFLGVPDPIPDGLGLALEAGILDRIGGPSKRKLGYLRKDSGLGAALSLVPPRPPKGVSSSGVRVLVRARLLADQPGEIRIGGRIDQVQYDSKGEPKRRRDLPRIDPENMLRIPIEAAKDVWVDAHRTLPESLGARPGRPVELVVFADQHVELGALALVPLTPELPPPAPEPWEPGGADAGGGE